MSRSSFGFNQDVGAKSQRLENLSKTLERMDKDIFTPDSGAEWIQIHSMTGLCKTRRGELIYHFFCFITLGMMFLIAHWFPEWTWLKRYKLVPLHDADFVLVLDDNGKGELCVVERISELSHRDIRLVQSGILANKDVAEPLQLIPSTTSPSLPPTQTTDVYAQYMPSPPLIPTPLLPMRIYHWILDCLLGEERVVPSSRHLPLIQRMIVYRSTRFIYDEDLDAFARLKPPHEYALGHLRHVSRHGLDTSTHRALLDLFGRNVLGVRVPGYGELFLEEVMHPFFVFQVYSIFLWCCEAYYIFATCIAFMAIFSVVITLVDTHRALQRLQQMASCDVPVRVVREGKHCTVSSLSLVPGDLLVVERGVMVCDAVLVKGRALVNEAVLTGESAPVNKAQLDIEAIKAQQQPQNSLRARSSTMGAPGKLPDDYPVKLAVDDHTLSAATEVLQARGKDGPKGRCLAVVKGTAFDTAKGALLLSLLYPRPSPFPFMTQALKFVFVLFCLAMVGFGISVWRFLHFGAPISLIIVRSFDLITIVVPPSLPLAMAVGTNNALNWLRESGIFCSQPSRVNVAGKIKMCCFDKTGTLTTTHLQLMGVRFAHEISENQNSGQIIPNPFTTFTNSNSTANINPNAVAGTGVPSISLSSPSSETSTSTSASTVFAPSIASPISPSSSSLPPRFLPNILPAPVAAGLALCHSLSLLHGRPVGDPLEVAMVEATGATVYDSIAQYCQSARHAPGCGCSEREKAEKHIAAVAVDVDCSGIGNVSPGISSPLGISHSGNRMHSTGSFAKPSYRRVWSILKQYPFSSQLMRMSVLARGPQGQRLVFTKGSPESLRKLCIPGSIPADYDEVVRSYTSEGYRVIALGYRAMDVAPGAPDGIAATTTNANINAGAGPGAGVGVGTGTGTGVSAGMSIGDLSLQPVSTPAPASASASTSASSSSLVLPKAATPAFPPVTASPFPPTAPNTHANATTSGAGTGALPLSGKIPASPLSSPRLPASAASSHHLASPAPMSTPVPAPAPAPAPVEALGLIDLPALGVGAALSSEEEDEDDEEEDEDDEEEEVHSAVGIVPPGLAPIPSNTTTNPASSLTSSLPLPHPHPHTLSLLPPSTTLPEKSIPERSEAERGLTFLALLVFENPLKPASAPTIAQLHAAGIRTAMITGDTALTAFAVAKNVGVLKKGRQLFAAQLLSGIAARNAPAPPPDAGSTFGKSSGRLSRSRLWNSGVGMGVGASGNGIYGGETNFLNRSLTRSMRTALPTYSSFDVSTPSPANPLLASSIGRGFPAYNMSLTHPLGAGLPTSGYVRTASSTSSSRFGIGWGSGYGSRSQSRIVASAGLLRQSLVFQHVLHTSQYVDPVSLKPFYYDGHTSRWGWDPHVDWRGDSMPMKGSSVKVSSSGVGGVGVDEYVSPYSASAVLPHTYSSNSNDNEANTDTYGGVGAGSGSVAIDTAAYMPFEFALSGDVISHLMQDKTPQGLEYLRTLLYSTVVFCRVSPELKSFIVESLMSLGLYVSMCGDGANDAPALKAAHIGVSLSESEASVAAPFTSKIQDISCVPRVLLQGRSALDTCFQLFRYMALYSVIQFACCIHLYFIGANLGDTQFLIHDMMLVFPLVVFLGETMAADTLTRKRPSGNLLSAYNLISVFSHMIICVATQFAVFLSCSHVLGYENLRNDSFGARKWEVTSLYYLCNFQYLLMAVLFAASSEWKKPLIAHKKLTGWIIFASLASLFLLLCTNDDGIVAQTLGITRWSSLWLMRDDVQLPMSWRWTILVYFLMNAVVSTLHQIVVLPAVKKLLDSARKRVTTDTEYGKGGLVSQNHKAYHVLRRRVEDKWYPNGRPEKLTYGAHATTATGVRKVARERAFYDSFSCYGNDDAHDEETITMLPRKRTYMEMLDNERVKVSELMEAELHCHISDPDYGQVSAAAVDALPIGASDEVGLGPLTFAPAMSIGE